ncbi:hypothetical protein Kisp02_72590 [Kineosporia sp. NBRC 101731]|nr:hypothetical protein Kisp02_72590 [Kineosporia sp. NBRC 101731]
MALVLRRLTGTGPTVESLSDRRMSVAVLRDTIVFVQVGAGMVDLRPILNHRSTFSPMVKFRSVPRVHPKRVPYHSLREITQNPGGMAVPFGWLYAVPRCASR